MKQEETVCDIQEIESAYDKIVKKYDELPDCLIVNSKDEVVLAEVLKDKYIRSSANDMYSNNILDYYRDIQVRSGILSSCKAKFIMS